MFFFCQFFFPLPFPLTFPLDLFVVALPPRRLSLKTERAVTIAPPLSPSQSSAELLLLLLLLDLWGRVVLDLGTVTGGHSWLATLMSLTGVWQGSKRSSDPKKPPPISVFLSSSSAPPAAAAAFPLLHLDGVGISSSLSSSPPSRSFLFMQVTARRSRWLRIVCFSCCSSRKNASILSWVFIKRVRKKNRMND